MNVAELRRHIDDAGQSRYFSISTMPSYSRGLPNDATIMKPSLEEPGRWLVFYTERGQVFDRRVFDSEDLACQHVHSILTRRFQPMTRGPLTVEERRTAATLAAEREERMRTRLVAAGLDPVTGKPS